jgi:CHAT domain-containing protein
LKRYLLGQLGETEEEAVELRLLTEADYSEELDMVVDEMIDRYVNTDISAEERETMERHFFQSPQRRDQLRFALALKRRTSEMEADKRRAAQEPSLTTRLSSLFSALFVPRWKLAIVALIILSVGIGTWRVMFYQPQVEKGLVALNQAYREQRPLEARITGLAYAPFVVSRGNQPEKFDYRERDRSASLLLGAASDNPTPTTIHALGRFYMTQREFDKAVNQFETALKSSPDNAQLHADLGAALLEQAKLLPDGDQGGSRMEKLAESLEHLTIALRLNPSLPEAMFNQALCLENMMLPEQARQAWQSYLALDSQSRWAVEAQRHLQEISERRDLPPTPSELLERFFAAFRARDEMRAWRVLSENREMITRKMIPPQLAHDYIRQPVNDQNKSAQESLRALVFAGELEGRRGGDHYTAELASYYAASSAARRRLLAEAIKELDAGYELCLETKYGEALRRFESARQIFDEAGDMWEARVADYWIAYCLTQAGRITESKALLSAVAEFGERHGYKWLHAQAAGWLAVNYATLNEHSSAIKYSQQSLTLAEAIHDTYQMQKALMNLGTLYASLRQPRLSLGCHYGSLALASQSNATPRQSWRNFTYTAGALFAFKYYAAAAAFTNEALHLARTEFKDPSLAYLQYLNLAQIYSKLRQFNEAVEQADIGLRIARSVQDVQASQKPLGNALLKQADIWRDAGDCGQAVAHYDQAISIYGNMEFDLYRYAAYKGRLLCERALGEDDAVRRDLPILLGLFERSRAQIREEQNRNSFFDSEQGVYDIAVEYEYGRENYTGAFNYAEAAHARSLLDAIQSGAHVGGTAARPEVSFQKVSSPADLESLRQQMPPQLQVVMYTALPTKLLIWSISREHFSVFQKEVRADALEADVNQYVNSLMTQRTGLNRASVELGVKLFDTLIGGVLKVRPGDRVCIIPDKFLYRLPFSALISPDSEKYLVEDWTLFYAPSLNVLLHCSEESRMKAQDAQNEVLSIGNPTFDRRAHPDLLPLRAAEKEAREIAKLYEHPSCLVGRDARKSSVMREMDSAEVVHFAGHYTVDESSPLLSRMLLADDDGPRDSKSSDPDLSAFEIIGHRFDRTRLVVLSACQTGLDKYYEGEGAVGLARAFMEAGVPLVVASQWPVDSDATAGLMINFHRHRRSGMTTTEALRQAQTEMLRGPDQSYSSPYYWAAFLCTGGYADY